MADILRSVPLAGVQGSVPLAPTLLAPGMTVVAVAIDGSQLIDPTLVFTVVVDFSPDGGVTWASEAGGMDPFPIHFTVQGRPGHPGSHWRSRSIADGLNRLVRGTIINNSPAPLTTTATITAA